MTDTPTPEARQHPDVPSSAVWTVPNAISMVRLALIVVFAVLFAARQDGWAIAALAAAGISDFLDGFLARRWHQVTRLGRLLDPAADRLLTVAMVLALAARGFIPWWLVAVLLVRDALVAATLVIAHHHHVESSQVTYVGKAATFGLYVCLPGAYLSMVALADWPWLHTLAIVGATMAAVLYWWSGAWYIRDMRTRMSA